MKFAVKISRNYSRFLLFIVDVHLKIVVLVQALCHHRLFGDVRPLMAQLLVDLAFAFIGV